MGDECSHLWEDEAIDADPELEDVEFVLTQRCWKQTCDTERELHIVGRDGQ